MTKPMSVEEGFDKFKESMPKDEALTKDYFMKPDGWSYIFAYINLIIEKGLFKGETKIDIPAGWILGELEEDMPSISKLPQEDKRVGAFLDIIAEEYSKLGWKAGVVDNGYFVRIIFKLPLTFKQKVRLFIHGEVD